MSDFVGNPEAARENINSWVEKLTKGNIKDLGKYLDTDLIPDGNCIIVMRFRLCNTE
jgi:serine protease inhibitor